jgi:hypothetical protein
LLADVEFLHEAVILSLQRANQQFKRFRRRIACPLLG